MHPVVDRLVGEDEAKPDIEGTLVHDVPQRDLDICVITGHPRPQLHVHSQTRGSVPEAILVHSVVVRK
jgi:hypothetical protein